LLLLLLWRSSFLYFGGHEQKMWSFLLPCHVYIDLTVRSTILQLLRVHESTTFAELGNLCGIYGMHGSVVVHVNNFSFQYSIFLKNQLYLYNHFRHISLSFETKIVKREKEQIWIWDMLQNYCTNIIYFLKVFEYEICNCIIWISKY